MFKNPWFMLVIGLMLGLALGYVLAEQQPIPPGKAMRLAGGQPAAQGGALPEGHPPVDGADDPSSEARIFEQQIAELEGLMAQNPDDPGLLVAMADAHFELARVTGQADRWQEARVWYERALAEGRAGDANVMTDLAVVFRNLRQYERALELLDDAIEADDDHWQAWFNKVVILNFDLHEHDRAREALRSLQRIAETNPDVPDLSRLEQEVMGS
jgi:tetratricopeptide (TPR) repeat protein